MEKLILTHFWGDEGESGTSHITFEYESKDKFVFDMLEKYKNHPFEYYEYSSMSKINKSDYETSKVEIFPGVYFSKGELNDIEKYISTLEEWFQKNKQKQLK